MSNLIIGVVLAGLVSITTPAWGQAPTDSLCVITKFDQIASDAAQFENRFSSPHSDSISILITTKLRQSLVERFQNSGTSVVDVLRGEDSREVGSYAIYSTVWINHEGTLYVNPRVYRGADCQKGDWTPDPTHRSLRTRSARRIYPDGWAITWKTNDGMVMAADSVVNAIQGDVYQLIVESAIRMRVAVDSFSTLALDSDALGPARDMAMFLKGAFEGQLARSGLIHVLTDWQEGDTTKEVAVSPNYIVNGSLSSDGHKLRIDVRTLKWGPEMRLLTHRFRVLDSLDIGLLSNRVTELTNLVSHAMEADFTGSSRTLAVVATTAEPSSHGVAREVVRAVVQKIKLLTRDTGTTGGEDPFVVQVMSDLDNVEKNSVIPASGSEIMMDLDTDHLLLLDYQDFGEQVRLTADLHSIDAERPAIGEFIHQADFDLQDLEKQVNKIVIKVTRQLLSLMRETNPAAVDRLLRVVDTDSIAKRILSAVKVRQVEKTRHIAFHFGTPIAKGSPELFLGQITGFYMELNYAFRPEMLRFGGDGGRLDGGFEFTVGLESTSMTGPLLTFTGPAVFTVLLNGTLTLTPWAYSTTAFNFTTGVGVGAQGLRYNLHPGDLDYVGSSRFRESEYSPVINAFGRVDFPMSFSPRMTVNGMLRWIRGLQDITQFASLPLERFENADGPTGKLGAWYLLFGLAYRF